MSQYKVTFQLSEQELEILSDALYSYSKSGLDSDVGSYVTEDVERFYDKVNGLYLEETVEDPALDSFIAQYGLSTVLKEPEKLEEFRKNFNQGHL
jgi:hypothetical protein